MSGIRVIPKHLLPHIPFMLGSVVLGIYAVYWVLIFYIQSEHTQFDRTIIYMAGGSLSMFFWSFRKAVCSDPGYVPIGDINEDHELVAGLTDAEKSNKRYCLPCKLFKTQQIHHCSSCKRCVINMDHHCVWTANCIGFNNRKSFNLILQWGTISLFFATIFGLKHIWPVLQDILYDSENDHFLWLIYHLLCFFVIIAGVTNNLGLMFFACSHLRYVLKGITTLDSMKGIEQDPQSKGKYQNYIYYFGRNPLLWLIPIGKPLEEEKSWNKLSSFPEEEDEDYKL